MNNKFPLVSVVMNCYNGDKYLAKAIDSIYEQSYSNWEIIFWDNASTDESSYIARSYDQRLRYFLAEKTTPLGEARNLAVQKASGKYVAFLDCDDMYLPDKLKHQVSVMELEKCSLSYGSAIIINEFDEHIGDNKVKEKSGNLLKHLLLNYEINMQSVMLRKSVIKKENLIFDDRLKFSPDYDLFMRFSINEKISSISNYLVKYRKTSGSLTNRSLEIIGSEVEITLNKIKNDKNFPDNLREDLDKAFNIANFYKCLPYINKGDYKTARYFALKGAVAKKKILIFYLLLWLPVNRNWLIKLII
ncbi:glycosyltransferase [Alphaproteobacteria bacterium]|nr:glycosyltransferase [Alphaproteobacteria bacterium]